jgi:hypothetical protein
MRKWLLILRYIVSDWRLARLYEKGEVNSAGGSTRLQVYSGAER